MKHLSVFVDESGNFGKYNHRTPYYIVVFVLHDQAKDLTQNITRLNFRIQKYDLPNNMIHTGPLIRGEHEYRDLVLFERKQVFDSIFHFTRTIDVTYHSIIINKKQLKSKDELQNRIAKQLSALLKERLDYFVQYDCIKIYYDFGQKELTYIISKTFYDIFNRIELKKVSPSEYKLLQVADMLCMLELISKKAERKTLSKSELSVFESARSLTKSYLKDIFKKRF